MTRSASQTTVLSAVSNHTNNKAVARHRTSAANLFHVPNYPKKLVIYQLAASPFWWVRYFADGKILRRSTKETDKRRAIEFAKGFYDEINYRQRQGLVLNNNAGFAECAAAVLEQQDAKVARKEMSAMMAQNDRYRWQKEVLPFFGQHDLKTIDYFVLERFINKLSTDKLTAPTIRNYLGLVRKVLSYAQRKGYVQVVPQFPKIAKVDKPRGWFNPREYRQLCAAAARMSGQVWEVRRITDAKGKEEIFVAKRQSEEVKPSNKAQRDLQQKIKASKLLRRVEMKDDLPNLIAFMVNSFIRPTDIKWMQYKHVERIVNEHTYLRLSLPISKKHDKPIVTMEGAVRYFERQREAGERTKQAEPEDFVFMPDYAAKRREAALTQLQRQFSVVLETTKLAKGARGEDRTLYSLRHTCIMYRLLYGEGLDLLTLARNARTSPEMIDRFYASHLSGEMNVGMLQSRRSRKEVNNSQNQKITKLQ